MTPKLGRAFLRVLLTLVLTAALAACGSLPPGTTSEEYATAQTLLQLVNQARSQPRMCGGEFRPAAAPLKLELRLFQAAQAHSEDMLAMQHLTHTGSDGSNPGQRIAKTGYQAATWGENAAAGYATPESVMAGWLGSSGHCKNIMNANFTEFGAGEANRYWTQKFARPQ